MSMIGKLILLSIMILSIFLPVRAARDPSPTTGFKKLVQWTLILAFCYVLATIYIYPRFDSG